MKILLILCFLFLKTFAQQSSITIDTSFAIYSTDQKVKIEYPEARLVSKLVSDKITAEENIIYASYDSIHLLLDIFKPLNVNKKIPAVIFIHGGGWRSGDRKMEEPFAQRLSEEGYAIVLVQYRLSSEAKYPAQLEDLRNAVRWLKANASSYSIDTNRIACLGVSAGGTLAALLGVTAEEKIYNTENEVSNYSCKIHAIIDIDGVLDLTDPAESGKDTDSNKPSAGKLWLGGSYQEIPEVWIKASPLTYAGKDCPPTLFINSSIPRFHAGRDEYISKLNAYGIYTEVHTIQNAPHPFWLFYPWFDKVFNYTVSFLKIVFSDN